MNLTYLQLLEKGNITPNFWCSKEYFRKAMLVEEESEVVPIRFVMDEDWMVFPPINTETFRLVKDLVFLKQKVWSDFPEWDPEGLIGTFLDYEYIYDPKAFLQMEGGNWAVFRKNCRKWPRRFTNNGGLQYDWIGVYPFAHEEELSNVLAAWLETKSPGDRIWGDQILLDYLYHGKNRKILFHKDKIYGVNIWDENYRYINFRFCICRPEEFLSEYMRLLFYTDPFIQGKKKLVNDGGILDNPNLKRFKDKMNPFRIRGVYSWSKEAIWNEKNY